MSPTPIPIPWRAALLVLLLALGGCSTAPTPPAAPTPASSAAAPALPAAPVTAPVTGVATAAAPTSPPRATAPPATSMTATPVEGATRAATRPATPIASIPAAIAAPTATAVPTPRGYAPGDPCAPYAAGAVPPRGRAAAGAPARLCIPALALAAPVVPVGATPAGAMAESPDPWAVGWYAPGPPPGARGNAALAGAVDARGVGPAVFWELDRLRAGDVLVVVDAAGVARRFVVVENAVYLRDDAPLTKVFGPAADANLALITGAGTWEPALGVYDSNRVVFARMQP